MQPSELAWLAGLIEGEGCIHIAKRKAGMNNILLKLSMTDKDVVDRAAAFMGTHVTVRAKRAQYKAVYSARLWGEQAVFLIADLFDWFGERRKAKALEALIGYATDKRQTRDGLCKRGHRRLEPEDSYTYKGKSWCRKCKQGK